MESREQSEETKQCGDENNNRDTLPLTVYNHLTPEKLTKKEVLNAEADENNYQQIRNLHLCGLPYRQMIRKIYKPRKNRRRANLIVERFKPKDQEKLDKTTDEEKNERENNPISITTSDCDRLLNESRKGETKDVLTDTVAVEVVCSCCLTFSRHKLIKGGEFGSVYRGQFQSATGKLMEATIKQKQFSTSFQEEFDSELAILKLTDHYENVIELLFSTIQVSCGYICTETYLASLENFIEGKGDIRARFTMTKQQILKKSGLGILQLHSAEISHGDIEPGNILLCVNSDGSLQVKLGGLEKGCQLKTLSPAQQKQLKENDITCYGSCCLFLETKSDQSFEGGPLTLNAVKTSTIETDKSLKLSLLNSMATRKNRNLPTINCILKHPYYFSSQEILNFFLIVSDSLTMTRDAHTLDKYSATTTKGDWKNTMRCRLGILLSFKYQRRMYDSKSAKDLLRLFRNLYNHRWEFLDLGFKMDYLSSEDKLVELFVTNFPYLLINTYRIAQKHKAKKQFSQYFSETYDFLLEE